MYIYSMNEITLQIWDKKNAMDTAQERSEWVAILSRIKPVDGECSIEIDLEITKKSRKDVSKILVNFLECLRMSHRVTTMPKIGVIVVKIVDSKNQQLKVRIV
jgi:F0F1-type ATP synthase delta subunit